MREWNERPLFTLDPSTLLRTDLRANHWGAPEKTYEQTIEILKNQLKQLQLDYVDLYLIHGPTIGT
jgi:diketogulonate reductase-like aldo/keto reductase